MNYTRHLPAISLSIFLIRLLITGASIGDSFTIIGLAGLFAYCVYLESKSQPVANKELWDRVIALEESNQAVKEKVSTITLANTLRR